MKPTTTLALGVTKKIDYICQRTKKSFNSSINGNLRVFQDHRKQAKINVFHGFPPLGNKPP